MTFVFCNPTINRKRRSQVVAIGGASVKSVKQALQQVRILS